MKTGKTVLTKRNRETRLNISDFVITFNDVENIRNREENIEPFSFLLPHIMLTL